MEHPELTPAQIYRRKYYQENKARQDANSRAWITAHPEEWKAYRRQYYHAHKEQLQAYRRTHYHSNHDAIRIRRAELRQKQYALVRQQEKAWRKAHPEYSRAEVAAYSARKKMAPVCDLSAAQWAEIKAAYGHRCVYCGRKMKHLTQDHIIALSKGGSHTTTNVVSACRACNSRKGNRAPLVPVQPLLLTVAKGKKSQ